MCTVEHGISPSSHPPPARLAFRIGRSTALITTNNEQKREGGANAGAVEIDSFLFVGFVVIRVRPLIDAYRIAISRCARDHGLRDVADTPSVALRWPSVFTPCSCRGQLQFRGCRGGFAVAVRRGGFVVRARVFARMTPR